MAALRLQMTPSLNTENSKSRFISANIYENCPVSEEHSIARHDDRLCFLHNCRYHLFLIGDNKESPEKLDAFCFNYQPLDCLYTLFMYRLSGKTVVKNGQVFDNVQRTVHFNHQHGGADRMPSIAKERLLRKKVQKTFVELPQKSKSMQTTASTFADGIEQVEETKIE